MNNHLINTQITARILFVYGAIVSFFLFIKTLLSITFKTDLVPLLVFLPVVYFFIHEILTNIYRYLIKLLNRDYFANPPKTNLYFSPRQFLDQDSPLFLITLGLLAFAFSLSLIKFGLGFPNQ